MQVTQAPLGGEYTGHVCFADRWLGFDDGFYAMARLLELLSMHQLTIDEILDEFTSVISTDEMLIKMTELNKFEVIDQLKAILKETSGQIIETDVFE